MDSGSIVMGGKTIVQGRAWDPHRQPYAGVLGDFDVSSWRWHRVMNYSGVVCLPCCSAGDIPLPSLRVTACCH